MTLAHRTEIGLAAVAATLLFQMAFRPFTLATFRVPFAFFSVSSATASVRPAFSPSLVFTSAVSFEMEPAEGSTKAHATGAYTVADDVAHMSVRLMGLKPDMVYAVRCADAPCSLKKPTVTADWKGRAFWSVDRAPFEGGVGSAGILITVARFDKAEIVESPLFSYTVISAAE